MIPKSHRSARHCQPSRSQEEVHDSSTFTSSASPRRADPRATRSTPCMSTRMSSIRTASARKRWCSRTSSRRMFLRSRCSRSTPAACTMRRSHCWIAWSAAISVASQVFYPDAKAIEQYVRDNGINGFYLGLEERQSCCAYSQDRALQARHRRPQGVGDGCASRAIARARQRRSSCLG